MRICFIVLFDRENLEIWEKKELLASRVLEACRFVGSLLLTWPLESFSSTDIPCALKIPPQSSLLAFWKLGYYPQLGLVPWPNFLRWQLPTYKTSWQGCFWSQMINWTKLVFSIPITLLPFFPPIRTYSSETQPTLPQCSGLLTKTFCQGLTVATAFRRSYSPLENWKWIRAKVLKYRRQTEELTLLPLFIEITVCLKFSHSVFIIIPWVVIIFSPILQMIQVSLRDSALSISVTERCL